MTFSVDERADAVGKSLHSTIVRYCGVKRVASVEAVAGSLTGPAHTVVAPFRPLTAVPIAHVPIADVPKGVGRIATRSPPSSRYAICDRSLRGGGLLARVSV